MVFNALIIYLSSSFYQINTPLSEQILFAHLGPNIPVVMLLQPESVDGHGGARAAGRTAQDSCTGGVVDVEILVVGACVPTHEVIQEVVGQGSGGATVGAAGYYSRDTAAGCQCR